MGDLVDTKELAELIKFLRKQGIEEYKTPQLSLRLYPNTKPVRSAPRKLKPALKEALQEISGENYSEDDTLFWSSGQVPEQES